MSHKKRPERSDSRFLTAVNNHPGRTFLCASTILILMIYGRLLWAPFVYDDLDQIVNNPTLGAWHLFVPRFLYRPVELTNSLLPFRGSTYRPLFWLSLYVDRRLWGVSSSAFHATSVILQTINVNLLFLLLRRVAVPIRADWAIGILWLSLPVTVEVVAWVSARSYLLCAFFILVSLLCAFSYLRSGNWIWVAGCCMAGEGALLSNEVAIALIPVVGMFALRQPSAKPKLLFCLGGLLSAGTFEVVRYKVGAALSLKVAPMQWLIVVWSKLFTYTLFLFHMSVERSTELSATHVFVSPWIVFTLFICCFVWTWVTRSHHRVYVYGLTWSLALIAPFCLFQNYQGLAERYAYLSSIGIVAAIVTLPSMLKSLYLRRLVAILICFWGLWNVARASVRVCDWTDPIRLYRASLLADPRSPALRYNLGYSLKERGELKESLIQYNEAIKLDRSYPHAFASVGDVYLQLGSYAAAQMAYRQALAQSPKDTAVMLNSGVAYQYAGQTAEAEAEYLQILKVDSKVSAAHVNLGVLFSKEQRYNEAAHQFAMAIDQKTSDPVPYYNLAALLQQAGRKDLAAVLYKKALELKPGDEDTLNNLRLLEASP